MLEHTFDTPLSLCPECGFRFDATSAMKGSVGPSPGDLSLCLSCGTLLLFDEQLRPIIRADPAELEKLSPLVYRQTIEAIAYIQRRGRL